MNPFKDKAQAFRCAVQAAAAKQFAQMRQQRRFKKDKSEKKPYKPGTSVLGYNPANLAYPESTRVPHIVKPAPTSWKRRGSR